MNAIALLHFVDQLTYCLVRGRRHEENLDHQNVRGYYEIPEEEFLGRKGAICSLVDEAIEQEYRARGIKCACQKSQNQPRVLRKCVAELERRDEHERTSQCQKEISWNVRIERKLCCERE